MTADRMWALRERRIGGDSQVFGCGGQTKLPLVEAGLGKGRGWGRRERRGLGRRDDQLTRGISSTW